MSAKRTGKWRYRADQASPSYPDGGVTPDGYVGWIQIPRSMAYIDDKEIGEERETVMWTAKELADKSGAPLVMVQTLMRSMRFAIEELRALVGVAVGREP